MLLVLSLLTGALVVFANMLSQVINNKVDPRMKHDRGDNSEIAI
jgi:peptide/nickel transport system permease protein